MEVLITRRFTFEMAHTLHGYDGPCSQIHGHSYKLYVTVAGIPCSDANCSTFGMVMDFSELKAIVGNMIINPLDHSLALRKGAYNQNTITEMRKQWSNIIETTYQPTCENMVVEFARLISSNLPASVRLHEVKLFETENSSATYRPQN